MDFNYIKTDDFTWFDWDDPKLQPAMVAVVSSADLYPDPVICLQPNPYKAVCFFTDGARRIIDKALKKLLSSFNAY